MTSTVNDPFDLQRFVIAQAENHDDALAELAAGRKQSHWMWYVFPQLRGLGESAMAQAFGVGSLTEATAYLQHPLLGARLLQCCEMTLRITGRSAREIFGTPDDLKLRSCATLFAAASPTGSVFARLLDRYYAGVPDERTLVLLRERGEMIAEHHA